MNAEVSLDMLQRFDHSAVSPLARDRRMYYALKRTLDLAIVLPLLALALPLMGLIWIIIKFDSPGPGLFVQERVGGHRWIRQGYSYWQERTFRMFKFRTMRDGCDQGIHKRYMEAFIQGDEEMIRTIRQEFGRETYKLSEDKRVTHIGRFLRRTSMDELPQIFNILRGDMTLIGPRPAIPYEVEMYRPWHRGRLAAIPGLTGLWQVSGRCKLNFDQMADLDIRYIHDQSIWLDLKIILQTPWAVISGKGAG